MEVLGIDIGGSSIKGAVVNTKTGELITDRIRIETPKPPKPKKMAEIVAQIAKEFKYEGIIGAGFPSVIKNGVSLSAANVHEDFVNANIAKVIDKATGFRSYIINDADAAGLAEMRFGTGKEMQLGSVLFLTIGTGIGSAFFINGHLFPNTELGHLQVRGKDAEHRASDAVRQDKKLSWKEWATRFSEVLRVYEKLFNPDIFILGGGASTRFDKYATYLQVDTKVIPAKLENLAGIIGAAMAAVENLK